MPLEKIVDAPGRVWGLWRVTESEAALHHLLHPDETLPPGISNTNKRIEWLVGRLLVQALLGHLGDTYSGIVKDEHGKPYPAGYPYHLSLSHSYPYVAALIDKYESVGIDLEQPKEKLLRIGPRVLAADELADAGTSLVKHCVYWCAKEALIKVYGKTHLTLASQLRVAPFALASEGTIDGRIIVADNERVVPLYYHVDPNFVLVFNQRSFTL